MLQLFVNIAQASRGAAKCLGGGGRSVRLSLLEARDRATRGMRRAREALAAKGAAAARRPPVKQKKKARRTSRKVSVPFDAGDDNDEDAVELENCSGGYDAVAKVRCNLVK